MRNGKIIKNHLVPALLVLFLSGLLSIWGFARDIEKRQKRYISLIKQRVPVITPQQLRNLSPKPVLLDSREYSEYYVSRLEQARYIGYKNFSLESVKDLDKERAIVVYCSLGVRSEKIALKLKKAGYKNVKNLLGGLFEWVNLGFPVYDHREKPTNKVHAYSKKWGKWLLKGTKIYKVKKIKGVSNEHKQKKQ